MDDNRIYYTVYCTTNLMNGKIYIGIHKTTDIYDSYLGSGSNLVNDISKFGKEHFDKSILYAFDNEEDMFEKEVELVSAHFLTLYETKTYNKALGGKSGNFGIPWSEKRKQDFSEYMKNNKAVQHHCKTKLQTPENLEKISKGLRRSQKFKRHLEKLHKELAIKNRGEGCWKSKLTKNDVIRIRSEYDKKYETAYQIAKRYSVDSRTIIDILNNKSWKHLPHTKNGYKPSYRRKKN